MNLDRILHGIALVLGVAALAWSLDTALSAPRRRALLDRKAEAIRSLRLLAGRHAAERAWLDAMETAGNTAPGPLAPLAARLFPDAAPSATPRAPVPAAAGWQMRGTLLTLSGVSFAELPAFCSALAGGHPPWRLRELELRPSAPPGTGDAVLLFESLEKGE